MSRIAGNSPLGHRSRSNSKGRSSRIVRRFRRRGMSRAATCLPSREASGRRNNSGSSRAAPSSLRRRNTPNLASSYTNDRASARRRGPARVVSARRCPRARFSVMDATVSGLMVAKDDRHPSRGMRPRRVRVVPAERRRARLNRPRPLSSRRVQQRGNRLHRSRAAQSHRRVR